MTFQHTDTWPARAVIDLDAIKHNVATLAKRADGAEVIAIVKGGGYGHGLLGAARAALAGGAAALGVAQLPEALDLRAALGPGPRILTWLTGPGADFDHALRAGLEPTTASVETLSAILAAARRTGTTATIHLKVDTGLTRGGILPTDLDELLDMLGPALAEGAVNLASTWSHLACGDEPERPETAAQLTAMLAAADQLSSVGINPGQLHLAASSGVLLHPATHLDAVRPGISIYGISPAPDHISEAEADLRPAMRLEGDLTLIKTVPAGTAVGYGLTESTTALSKVGLVPLGYADGVPRVSRNLPATVDGVRTAVVGRVSMDQIVLDLGLDSTAIPGQPAVLFGDPARGEPSVQEWAASADTIAYEIVSRVGPRVPRVYTGAPNLIADLPPYDRTDLHLG